MAYQDTRLQMLVFLGTDDCQQLRFFHFALLQERKTKTDAIEYVMFAVLLPAAPHMELSGHGSATRTLICPREPPLGSKPRGLFISQYGSEDVAQIKHDTCETECYVELEYRQHKREPNIGNSYLDITQ